MVELAFRCPQQNVGMSAKVLGSIDLKAASIADLYMERVTSPSTVLQIRRARTLASKWLLWQFLENEKNKSSRHLAFHKSPWNCGIGTCFCWAHRGFTRFHLPHPLSQCLSLVPQLLPASDRDSRHFSPCHRSNDSLLPATCAFQNP